MKKGWSILIELLALILRFLADKAKKIKNML